VAGTSHAAAINVDVKLNGTEVSDAEVVSFVVDRDLDRPSMAVVTLANQGHKFSNDCNQGHSLEILVRAPPKLIFKGEIVAIEPIYKAGEDQKCVVRAFDKSHRMLRGRKSRTFQDQSDQDIVSKVAGEYGLNPQCGNDPKITHKHVYQHNQTDWEFVLSRAARLGFSVWFDEGKLHFDKVKTDKPSGIEFHVASTPTEKGHRMSAFSPRLSSATVVKKVTVRGWNPEKKEEIKAEVEATNSKLGKTSAASAAEPFGTIKTYTVDHPIFSVEEAQAIAKAKLAEHSLSYITGEAEAYGDPSYKEGLVVKVLVNDKNPDDRFNGLYLVRGVTHRFTKPKGGKGGYFTVLRLARDAEKGEP